MARCELCGKIMRQNSGCIKIILYDKNGKTYDRVKVGDPGDFLKVLKMRLVMIVARALDATITKAATARYVRNAVDKLYPAIAT